MSLVFVRGNARNTKMIVPRSCGACLLKRGEAWPAAVVDAPVGYVVPGPVRFCMPRRNTQQLGGLGVDKGPAPLERGVLWDFLAPQRLRPETRAGWHIRKLREICKRPVSGITGRRGCANPRVENRYGDEGKGWEANNAEGYLIPKPPLQRTRPRYFVPTPPFPTLQIVQNNTKMWD